jgi:hypothetical protein
MVVKYEWITKVVFYDMTLRFTKPVPRNWGKPDYKFKAELGAEPFTIDGGKTAVFPSVYREESNYPQDFKPSLKGHSV